MQSVAPAFFLHSRSHRRSSIHRSGLPFCLDGKRKVTCDGTFLTSLSITAESVVEIADGPLARSKIEQETFNVLKNDGYHLACNFAEISGVFEWFPTEAPRGGRNHGAVGLENSGREGRSPRDRKRLNWPSAVDRAAKE